MDTKIFQTLLNTTFAFLMPVCLFAQQIKDLDEFDSEVHLDIRKCLVGDIGFKLECLALSLERCDGFVDELSTAGGRYVCSYTAFNEIDAELNAVYPTYLAAAVENVWGAEREAQAREQLRDAQRAWIAYRDAICEVNAGWRAIHSGHDAVVSDCMSRLTLMQLEVLSIELGEFIKR